jgi:hypothetical protein
MTQQPALTGHQVPPERLGYMWRPDLSTAKVSVYMRLDGKRREFDADKGAPLVWIDDRLGEM